MSTFLEPIKTRGKITRHNEPMTNNYFGRTKHQT